jgi:hypothetical protein
MPEAALLLGFSTFVNGLCLVANARDGDRR